ncbi:snurportin-1-like [Babylonia areolata]|uniref:snurportin-1-like n=1 Tax=Babylonia areolata TaxID=304850 RepID=UPI003FD4E71F
MGKRKKKNKGYDDDAKRLHLSIPLPVPDDQPNWPGWDRHEVMMSVSMEIIPPNFEKEYVAVVCPVAKRRTVVSAFGWTCSYNKLLNMDRKFQSALPGGNVTSLHFSKGNELCILDCLHLKAERTFYILDLMVWKQLPYYESDTDFRFHWINQIVNETDLLTVHPENEYKFRAMPRIRCTRESLYSALDTTPFKVDGILFFNKFCFYTPGSTPNVLWLPPQDIHRVLGWLPPQRVLSTKSQPPPPATIAAPGEAQASVTAAAPEEAQASVVASAPEEAQASAAS